VADDDVASDPSFGPAGDCAGVTGERSRETADRRYLVGTQRGADLLAVSLMLVFVTAAVTLSLMPVVTKICRIGSATHPPTSAC